MVDMKLQRSKVAMVVIIVVLLFSISSVYAENAEEFYVKGILFMRKANNGQAISAYNNGHGSKT